MIDNEIIKALSICSNENGICSECPYSDDYTNCNTRIAKDALDLINRLQAKVIKEQNKNSKLRNERNRLQAEIERLNKVYQANQQLINALNKSYFLAKAEAYKEFAERLKENINKRFVEDNTMIYRCVHIKDIDNLLKEMAGEDNAKEKE